jgi:hypothetical protein
VIASSTSVPLKMKAKMTGSVPHESDLEFVAHPNQLEDVEKGLFLFFEFQNIPHAEVQPQWSGEYTSAKNQIAFGEESSEVLTFPAADEQNPSLCMFRAFGELSSTEDTVWSENDSPIINVVFSFEPAAERSHGTEHSHGTEAGNRGSADEQDTAATPDAAVDSASASPEPNAHAHDAAPVSGTPADAPAVSRESASIPGTEHVPDDESVSLLPPENGEEDAETQGNGTGASQAEAAPAVKPESTSGGEDTIPEGTIPEGTPPEGTIPEGTPLEDTMPEGTPLEGTTAEGILLEGTTAEGIPPEDTTPEGIPPEDTTPEGTPLEGTTAEGFAPAAPIPDAESGGEEIGSV